MTPKRSNDSKTGTRVKYHKIWYYEMKYATNVESDGIERCDGEQMRQAGVTVRQIPKQLKWGGLEDRGNVSFANKLDHSVASHSSHDVVQQLLSHLADTTVRNADLGCQHVFQQTGETVVVQLTEMRNQHHRCQH